MPFEALSRSLAQRPVGIMDAGTQCAVLVPLISRADGLHLLYQVRSAALRRQPGEVCFPGGHIEPGEIPLACALRETGEELAIPARAIRVLGPLDLVCGRGNFVMHPFLALVEEASLSRMTLCPEEVERVFTVPVRALAHMEPEEYRYQLTPTLPPDFPYEKLHITRDYPWRAGTESGPIYPWQDKVIWGLTARVTRHVLTLLKKEGLV